MECWGPCGHCGCITLQKGVRGKVYPSPGPAAAEPKAAEDEISVRAHWETGRINDATKAKGPQDQHAPKGMLGRLGENSKSAGSSMFADGNGLSGINQAEAVEPSNTPTLELAHQEDFHPPFWAGLLCKRASGD